MNSLNPTGGAVVLADGASPEQRRRNHWDTEPAVNPDFKITSAVLYHEDLKNWKENTELSGNGEPSPFYMFEYHQSRMLAAVNDLPGTKPLMLQAISGTSGLEQMRKLASQAVGTEPLKLRFTLDLTGTLRCTVVDLGSGDHSSLKLEDYLPSALPDPEQVNEDSVTWHVGISSHKIEPIFGTRHKTSAREHYDLAFRDAPKPDGSHRVEALVFNEKDQLMEGCSTTPYFWRDGQWITPHADCGGNLGTTRRWALEKKLAVESIIMKDSVSLGEIVVLSNGVRGFGIGKILKI